jgi:hypothetical protein
LGDEMETLAAGACLSPMTSPTSTTTPPDPLAPTARSVYLFLRPLLAGKTVLDVTPSLSISVEVLVGAGAGSAAIARPDAPKLDATDASVDVVLCLNKLTELADDVSRHRWLAELARVVAPGGCCVVRAANAAATDKEKGGRAPAGPGIERSAFEELLRFHFSRIDIVSQSTCEGVAFSASRDAEPPVTRTDLASVSDNPTYHLALCSKTAQKTWATPESILVPTAAGLAMRTSADVMTELERLRSRHQEVCVERDHLRETVMTSEDQRDKREQTLSTLRREAERYLRQISDDAAALELLSLDRERAERRAVAAEQALATATAEKNQREADVIGLENELARLRKAVKRPASTD